MQSQIKAILEELEKFGSENDAVQEEYSKRMMNLAPETAQLLSVLVRSGNRKKLLEIGTSNGYSTIWLAWAASITDGHVISLDRDSDKHALADSNLSRAGLRDRVALMQGDATELIRELEGTFDFVFFDADRFSAPQQLQLLVPKLEAGALVLADNALSHPDQIEAYLQTIASFEDFEHMIIPIGKGLSVAYKQT